jgi:hypothetical protein
MSHHIPKTEILTIKEKILSNQRCFFLLESPKRYVTNRPVIKRYTRLHLGTLSASYTHESPWNDTVTKGAKEEKKTVKEKIHIRVIGDAD